MRIDRLLPSTQVASWIGPYPLISAPTRISGGWKYFNPLSSVVGLTQTGTAFTTDGTKINWANGSPSYLTTPVTIDQTAESHYVCVDIMINGWSNPDSHVGVGFDETPHVTGHYFVQARLSGGSETISILQDTVAWRQNTSNTFVASTWYRIGQRWDRNTNVITSYLNGVSRGSYAPGVLSPGGLKPSIHAYGGAASYSFMNLYYWYGSASENPPQF